MYLASDAYALPHNYVHRERAYRAQESESIHYLGGEATGRNH